MPSRENTPNQSALSPHPGVFGAEPLKTSVVQRHPKGFGILGPFLTPLIAFAIAASIMLPLELSGFGVFAALTGAMPFVAALGAGVPALLAFAAIIAAAALVMYGISVAIAHVATRQKQPAAPAESTLAPRNEAEAGEETPGQPGHYHSPTAAPNTRGPANDSNNQSCSPAPTN